MHIVHIYKDYYPVLGGIEGFIQQLAEQQVANGHQVTVLVTNPGTEKSDEHINGVQLIRASRLFTLASTPISLSMPFILKQLAPNLVHLHFPYPIGEVSQWLAGKRWPYVISYHCDVVQQEKLLRLYKPLLKKVLKGAARIMPTSANYQNSSSILSVHHNQCTPVPLGIDTSVFDQTKVAPVKQWPQLSQQRKNLLFVGRHRYYKGVDDLIKALPETEANLLIAGDGKEQQNWRQLAQQLGLNERIHFLGNIQPQDLPGLYRAADIFVLPSNSRAEAFGIVLMEAMAAGLPCITTELTTGTSYLVKNGVTGLVVQPRQPGQLAQAINSLCADPAMAKHMGTAGRQRVNQVFSLSQMVTHIDEVYQQTLEQPMTS